MKGMSIAMESEFTVNYEEMKKLLDPLVFGNLKNETQIMVKDARMLMHKMKVIKDGNEIIEKARTEEEKEEEIKRELKVDKRNEIIEKNEELKAMENEIQKLIEKRKIITKKRDNLIDQLECEKYEYKTQSTILSDLQMKNELTGKIISMKGDLDVGILICNKEIIPFDMKGMNREERKQYLCDLILSHNF